MNKGKKVENKLEMMALAYNGISQRLVGYKCPVCGAEAWWYDPQVRYLMHFYLDQTGQLNPNPHSGSQAIAVLCNNCGYVMLFDVARALNYIPNGKGINIDMDVLDADNYHTS
ncbi:MAG: hypothetical protein NC217_02215 [Muribaculaceae bacterium]|nr:hypothetical protein [Muribaculaceae bacterium]